MNAMMNNRVKDSNLFGCSDFARELPDLILVPGAMPSAAAATHLRECPPCAEEYLSYQGTFTLLDGWQAPEPSPFFAQKMAVRLREEQAAPQMGWLERAQTSLNLNTGRHFRPMLAGALALLMVAGGGGLSLVSSLNSTGSTAVRPTTSATVEDLQILDRNEQAFQQMDVLQQEEDNAAQSTQDAPVQPHS
jgi:hypothetical protein